MGGVGTRRCFSSNLERQLSLYSTGWGEGAKEELDEAGQGIIGEGRLSIVSKARMGILGQIL